MNGKDICKELKAIRRGIAEENGIDLEIPECSYQGPCRGTCPRCESEVRMLERELAKRIKLGKAATVAGISLSMATLGASCGNAESPNNVLPDSAQVADTSQYEGIVPMGDDTIPPPPSLSFPLDTFALEGIVAQGEIDTVEAKPSADSLPNKEINTEYIEGEAVDEGDEIYFKGVDVEAEFPGGVTALQQFIVEHLQYPAEAKENGVQGKVYVQLIVEKDGSVIDVRVLRDIGGGCGQEARRVVKSMPQWKPAMKDGQPVRFEIVLPFSFKLE